MLRQALRRVLWLVPTVAFISVLAFWILTSTPEQRALSSVPRLFNPQPADVVSLSNAAVIAVREREPGAAQRLASLGGAALPNVLPQLDALDPDARARVALALAPVAERMGVARDKNHRDPRTAALFWTRFWQDRSIDFRPVAVRRAVRRLAERPSPLRVAEVRAFDTYALPDLVSAMGRARDEDDRELMMRLDRMLSHVTGSGGPTTTGAKDARTRATDWLRWWPRHAHRYEAFQGASRIVAMLRETRYGQLITTLATAGLGATPAQKHLLDSFWSRATVTTTLLVGSLVLGNLVGIFWSLLAAARSTRLSLAVTLGALGLVGLPPVAYAIWLSPGLHGSLLVPTLIMTSIAAAATSLIEGPAIRDRLTRRDAVIKRAFGISRRRAATRAIGTVTAGSLARLGTSFPAYVTIALVVERAFALDGLGGPIVQALSSGDVALIMLVVVGSVVCVGFVQLVGDLLLALATSERFDHAGGSLR